MPHDADRRRFLEWAARGLVVVSAPTWVGCAAADPTQPGEETGGSPGTLTAAQRLAAIDAVRRIAGQTRTPSGALDVGAAAQALRALPGVSAAGASVASGSAWAVLRDGRRIVIANPGAPTPPAIRETTDAVLTPSAIPSAGLRSRDVQLASRQARVLDCVGAVPVTNAPHVVRDFVDDSVIPNVRELLQARGYRVVGLPELGLPGNDEAQTVEGLKRLSGDGLILWTAVGGVVEPQGQNGSPLPAIATTTRALRTDGGTTLDTQYEEDLDAGRLVYLFVPDFTVPNSARVVYGVTPDFARFYNWSFTAPAFAFLNVSGGGAVTGPWESVLAARGVGTFLSWAENPVLPAMLGVLEDLVHLTMATNVVDPRFALETEPRLRNYGNGETLQFMESRGALPGVPFYNPQAGGGSGAVNVFTPTVDYCLIDEDLERVELVGQFGAMLSGSIRIGDYGTPFSLPIYTDGADPALRNAESLSIQTTGNDLLRASLPRRHLGGVLQVFNDLRWSNAVPLTFWPLIVTHRLDVAQGPRIDCTVHLDFRGDVRGYRLRPDQPLVEQLDEVTLVEMRGSRAQWSASGSATRTEGEVTTTVSWSGSGLVTSRQEAGGLMAGQLTVRLGGPSAELSVLVQIFDVRERTVITRRGLTTSDTTENRPVLLAVPTSPGAPITVSMDQDFNIQAAERTATDTIDVLGQRSAVHTLTWVTTTARFAPEKDRGGR